jgi:hypothetical protein
MNKFDYYDFIGVLAPGAAFIFLLSIIFEKFGEFIQKPNFSLGDLGIIVFIAYITGHLLQGIGNIIEFVYWAIWNGKPTDWIRTNKHNLISAGQTHELELNLQNILKIENVNSLHELSAKAWGSIVNKLYGSIKFSGRDARAYTFNGNYGLMRGVAAGLFVTIVILLLKDVLLWKYALLCFAGFCLAIFRMHRFGCYYAREIITSYLNIPRENYSSKKAKTKE